MATTKHHWLGEAKAFEENLVHLRRRRDEMKSSASPVLASDIQA
jgi:hypothetical protein